MLNNIKILLGITDNSKDALILLLISQCKEEILNFTHNDDCLPFLENTLIDMVIYKYNRLGSEGLQTESYSGVNYNYETDYPLAV